MDSYWTRIMFEHMKYFNHAILSENDTSVYYFWQRLTKEQQQSVLRNLLTNDILYDDCRMSVPVMRFLISEMNPA